MCSVCDRSDTLQFFGYTLIGARFIDCESPCHETVFIAPFFEPRNHLVAEDLCTLCIGEDAFYTRSSPDLEVMAVQDKEDEHAGVSAFAAYTPALEEFVGEIKGVHVSDRLQRNRGKFDQGLLIEGLGEPVESVLILLADDAVRIGDIVVLPLFLRVGHRGRRVRGCLG